MNGSLFSASIAGLTMHEWHLRGNLDFLFFESGLSISGVARKIGVSRKTIQNWMTGQMPKNPWDIKKLADHFGFTLDEIMFTDLAKRYEKASWTFSSGYSFPKMKI